MKGININGRRSRLGARKRRLAVRIFLGLAIICAAVVVIGTRPCRAQYAAQLYPYCALSPASGATTCYYRSREECGSSCISNPWYLGRERAWAYTHGGRPLAPRYVRP
jgi:hypothetical protein